MAEFGANVTEVAPVQAHDTVREGVAKQPHALQQIANVFAGVNEFRSQQKATRQQEFLTNFGNEALSIINAVDQGVPGYTSRYARTLLRNKLIAAREAHPGLTDEIMDTYNSVLGQAGMGDIITSGTKDELLQERIRQSAVDNGLVDPWNATEADYRNAAYTLAQRQAADERYRQRIREIDEELKRIDLSSSRRSELEALKVTEAERVISESAPFALRQFTNQANTLVNDPNLSQSEKLTQLDNYWINMQAEFSGYVAQVSSTKADAYFKAFEERKKLTEELIRGERDQAEIEREMTRTKSIIEKGMLDDPEVAAAFVAIETFGQNLHPSVQADVARVTARLFNQGAATNEPPPNTFTSSGDRKAVVEYFEYVANAPDTPVAQEEQRTQIERMVQGWEDYGNSLARNPETGVGVLDILSSSDFLTMRNKYPELFDDTSGVENILDEHLYSEVWGLVEREFVNNSVALFEEGEEPTFTMMGGVEGGGTVRTTPTSDLVEARVTPGGINFVPYDKTNMEAKTQAQKLNKDVKPIINKVVRASAHLEGRTDYSTILQENLNTLFQGTLQESGRDQGDDLELDDFIMQSIPQIVGLVDETETGGTGDYNTLLGFSQKGKFAGTKLTEMTINEALKFASPSGPYGSYSRDVVGRTATPMGRYQIVGTTLRSLRDELGLSGEELFDESMQDTMFKALLDRRIKPGMTDAQKVSSLRKEWEGLKYVSAQRILKSLEDYM